MRLTVLVCPHSLGALPLDKDLLTRRHLLMDLLGNVLHGSTLQPMRSLFVVQPSNHFHLERGDRPSIRHVTCLWLIPDNTKKGKLCHISCKRMIFYDANSNWHYLKTF